jgi:hypothetical protein
MGIFTPTRNNVNVFFRQHRMHLTWTYKEKQLNPIA